MIGVIADQLVFNTVDGRQCYLRAHFNPAFTGRFKGLDGAVALIARDAPRRLFPALASDTENQRSSRPRVEPPRFITRLVHCPRIASRNCVTRCVTSGVTGKGLVLRILRGFLYRKVKRSLTPKAAEAGLAFGTHNHARSACVIVGPIAPPR